MKAAKPKTNYVEVAVCAITMLVVGYFVVNCERKVSESINERRAKEKKAKEIIFRRLYPKAPRSK